MDVQPIIRFLHTVESAWRYSDNEEAQTRAKKLSNVLEKGNVITQKWKSDMKCDPPQELSYMNVSNKTLKPNRQRRGSMFPGGISISNVVVTSDQDPSKVFIHENVNGPKEVKSDLELTSFSQR